MSIVRSIAVRSFRSIGQLQAEFPTNCIYLSGPNGAGKSTLAESVLFALHGGKPPKVSDEADAGTLTARLSNGWTIKRRVPKGGRATVTVTTGEGAAMPAPQQALDALVGPAATDLDAVAAMKPDDQVAVFLHLAGRSEEMAALQASRKAAYEARRDLNRDIKRNEAAAAAITVPRDLPTEEQVAAARAAVRQAQSDAEEIRAGRRHLQNARNALENARQRRETAEKAVAEYERLLADAKTALGEAQTEHREQAAAVERLEAAPEPAMPDVEKLQAEADDLADRRAKAGNAEQRDALLAEAAEWRDQVAVLEQQMADADAGIRDLFSGLKGLAYDPDSGTVSAPNARGDLLPLADLSDGERLLALCRAMLAAPRPPKILRLKHGTELDAKAMHELKKLSTLHDDTLLLVERIDDTVAGLELVCVDDGAAPAAAPAPETIPGGLFGSAPTRPPAELNPEDQA